MRLRNILFVIALAFFGTKFLTYETAESFRLFQPFEDQYYYLTPAFVIIALTYVFVEFYRITIKKKSSVGIYVMDVFILAAGILALQSFNSGIQAIPERGGQESVYTRPPPEYKKLNSNVVEKTIETTLANAGLKNVRNNPEFCRRLWWGCFSAAIFFGLIVIRLFKEPGFWEFPFAVILDLIGFVLCIVGACFYSVEKPLGGFISAVIGIVMAVIYFAFFLVSRAKEQREKKKPRLIITGATGFVGGFLAYEMLKRGESLILLARDGDREAAADRIAKKLKVVSRGEKKFKGQFQVVAADITKLGLGIKQKDLALFRNVGAIWHCAALSQFNGKFQSAIRQTNVEGTRNVLEFARKIGARRFHYVSSAYVCGNQQGTVFENELVPGQTFKNTYEESKFEAEKLVKECGLQTTIYRPSIVVGSSKNGVTTTFTGFNYLAKSFYWLRERLLHSLKKKPNEFDGSGIAQTESGLVLPIRIPCSENGTVNLVCVDYVVETMLMLAEKSESVGKVFHVTNQTPPKGRDLFKMSGNILGMTGLAFASNRDAVLSNPPQNEMLRKYEELFTKEIDPYISYLSCEPFFDNGNVREVLGVEYKPHRMIDDNLLKTLLDYGIARHWNRE